MTLSICGLRHDASVPTGCGTVKPASITTHFCTECWQECSAKTSRRVFGRELCAQCATAEETAYAEFNAPSEDAYWGSVSDDRMSSLKSVLVGMGL